MRFGNKGQIETLLALAMLGGALIAIPFFVFKFNFTNVIVFESKYNNADLAMLSLLSMKNNGEYVPQILAEHLTLNNPSDISFVNKILDETVPSKCYELSTGTTTQVVPTSTTSTTTTSLSVPSTVLMIKSLPTDCTPDTFTKAQLVLPYNPNKVTESLELSTS